MRIVVLGGTGRTGRLLVERLAAVGHEVVALGRRVPEGWRGEAIVAAPDDRAALARALEGAGAVMSALGSTKRQQVCLPATRALIDVASEGLPYVVVGGAAVDLPEDRKGLPDRIVSRLARLFAGPMVAERQEELAVLQKSRLRWTFLRPPQLRDEPGTGRWAFSFDKPAHFRIPRADLAGAMIEAMARDDLAQRAPFVAGRR